MIRTFKILGINKVTYTIQTNHRKLKPLRDITSTYHDMLMLRKGSKYNALGKHSVIISYD